MSVARRKGNPGKADMLVSRIVRSRGHCERCGDRSGPFDCAHIIGRRYSATRCVEDNLACLCKSCHYIVDMQPHEKMFLVEQTIGVDRYKDLYAQAQAGIGTWNAKQFWLAEVERLMARCKQLGLDTRWRVPA